MVISEDIFEQQHVNALGWLLAKGILEIKIAFVFDKNGQISHDGLAMFHQKIGILYDDDNNIIGLLIFWISKKPAFYHSLKTVSLKLLIVDILDYFVLCDVEKGDFHVAELAIDESQRGKGLGSKVLDDVIGYAKGNNLKRVTLDADFRNTGAKSLYERIGFKEFNKKRVKIGSFERGMHNMELKL